MLKNLKVRALSCINYTLKLKGVGGPVSVPVINNVGRAHLDVHEPHMDLLLARLYSPKTLLIDVGVNIGQTLVKYASIAGTGCRYIGFEPNIKAAAYVDELIIRNGMHNAMIVPIGLGSQTRLAKLYMASLGSTDPGASVNQQVRDKEFYETNKLIAVFNGDQVLSELGVEDGPVILKIDVEGSELEVICGLERSIERLRPLIILEILPPSNFSAAVNGYRRIQAEKLKRHLHERGYTEYSVDENGRLVSGLSPTCDYLFVPNEKTDQIKTSSPASSVQRALAERH